MIEIERNPKEIDETRVEIQQTRDGDFQLATEMFVGLPIGEVFEFFSDARKLEAITPPWLNFSIITSFPIEMQEGALIDYRLKIRKLPVRWRTEISAWQPPFRFVDQQLRGPYSKWVHEHIFTPLDGGTLVEDRVRYRVPGGGLIHRFFVKPDLEKIFRFRQDTLRKIFDEKILLKKQALAVGQHTPNRLINADRFSAISIELNPGQDR